MRLSRAVGAQLCDLLFGDFACAPPVAGSGAGAQRLGRVSRWTW